MFLVQFCSNQSAREGWLLHFPLNCPFSPTIDTGGTWSAHCNTTRILTRFSKEVISTIKRNHKDLSSTLRDFNWYWLKDYVDRVDHQSRNLEWRRNKSSTQILNIRVLSCLGWSNAGVLTSQQMIFVIIVSFFCLPYLHLCEHPFKAAVFREIKELR